MTDAMQTIRDGLKDLIFEWEQEDPYPDAPNNSIHGIARLIRKRHIHRLLEILALDSLAGAPGEDIKELVSKIQSVEPGSGGCNDLDADQAAALIQARDSIRDERMVNKALDVVFDWLCDFNDDGTPSEYQIHHRKHLLKSILTPKDTNICPKCNGDGIERCENPDHGFLNAIGFSDMGRLGCPLCGHDPNHRIIGSKCPECNGTGKTEATNEQ